ncbi:MAG: chloride channel protein, partial [Acetobacteraceae bacterium]|nr:chloride channel protein [Acetobacteraceae bacterium]
MIRWISPHHARQLRLQTMRLWAQSWLLLGGCAIGVAGVVMALGAAAAERVFARIIHPAPEIALVLTPIGFASVAWITRKYFPNTEGSGIPQAIAARKLWGYNERARLVGLKLGIGKIALTLAGLLCGASIGREGPTVQVGASIMFAIGRLSPARQPGLILAGASAGIAAAFNTPLAGVIFGIEEMSRAFDERTNGLTIGAIIAAGIVSLAALGNYTYFGVSSADIGTASGWLAVPMCGVVGGLAGGLFSRILVEVARGLPGALGPAIKRHPIWFAVI